MSNNSFQVYLDGVLTMAQTMVVKSVYTAERINDRLRDFLEYKTDPHSPETWKYYMNLAGEYHPTDTVMKVISSDNLELIVFNKDNLKRHRKTSRDYQFGTRQYGELLEKYPGQEDVILGILYPVNKAAAIAAVDHKILGCHPKLLETNEYTLIESLQEWTDIYFKRYYNHQYTISDDLYYGVVLSMYYMNLIPAILTQRLKRHKTVEANSFYVRQYLASNSDLGKYHPMMNLPQAMHFYRNIRYYQRHIGSNDTLEKLTDALLTKRIMPLAEYTMRHDTSTHVEKIYPEIVFRRKDLTEVVSAGAPEHITLQTMMEKEIDAAPGNDDEIAENIDHIHQTLKDSPSNVVLTKVLESAMVDFSKAVTYDIARTQTTHWLYYAHKGLYTAVVSVTNPKTNERIVLTVKDAYILATYIMYRSFDMEPTEIPLFAAERVQRYPLPSDADIKSIVDMKYITDFTWETLIGSTVPVESMISVDSFYETTAKINAAANFQRDLISFQEGMYERCEVMKIVGRHYSDETIRLVPKGTTYQQWLLSKSLNFDDLKQNEHQTLYERLIAAAIGSDLVNTPSLRNVQAAMIDAMRDLNSYTVQFTNKMADEKTVQVNFPSIRVGEQVVDAENHELIRLPYIEVKKQDVEAEHLTEVGIDFFGEVLSRDVTASTSNFIDLQNGPHAPDRGMKYEHKWPLSRMEFFVANKPDVSGTSLPPILGMGYFIGLTADQKASLFD